MPESAGSFERLAIELARVFGRLAGKLSDDAVLNTLADLGVRFPEQFLADATISAARTTVTTVAGQLDQLAADLGAAIESGDAAQATAAAVSVVTQVGRTTAAIAELSSAIGTRGPTLPGITATQVAELTSGLADKLTALLLADLLELSALAAAVLTVLGVIERTADPGNPDDPTRPDHDRLTVHLERLLPALTNPVAHLADLYGWGTGTLDAVRLLTVLEGVLGRLGLPALLIPPGPDTPVRLQAFALDLTPTEDGAGLALTFVLAGSAATPIFDVPLSAPTWTAHIEASGELAAETTGELRPPLDITLVPPAGTLSGQVTVGVTAEPAEPFLLLGQAGGSRLEFGRLEVRAAIRLTLDPATGRFQASPVASGEVTGGRLVIDLSRGDGFISTVTGGARVESQFGVGFSFAADTGLRFHGSGALEIAVPVHLELGPVEVQTIYLAARIAGASVPIELSAGLTAHLGPVTATVDRVGAVVDLGFPAGGGNLGPANLAFAFKPPTGVGLAVNAGLLAGGGFLFADPDRGEYAGALELEFGEFLDLKAIGLISTRMPDGSTGFSLLIVLTAEFGGTGIQLGYGFTLLAVGGILGLNRAMNLPALVEGVRTGAIESVAFPRDVVANAPRILSDLRTFFPPQPGTFVVGPLAKIGWGTPTLVSVSLGVVIEIPGDLAVLGVLRAVLPTVDLPLLSLQVAFVGALEFDKKRLWFFAQLFSSRVLTMPLTGGMGLLVAWGDNPDLVITAGGFHPAYNPPPLPFGVPDRMQVDVLNEPGLLIRVSGYFAITSNTVQFGGRADLRLGFSAFGITGHVDFDALFQFSPFRFIASSSGRIAVTVFGIGLFTIDLQLKLEGPAPWRAHGRGKIGFLFFSIPVNFDRTWGESRDTTLPPVDVLELLAAEISKVEGWQTRPPAGRAALVTVRTLPPADELVVHPLGALVVRQRAIPLDVRVDRIGGRPARDGRRFSVAPPSDSGLVTVSVIADKFAMAQYQDLSDADKLSLPAYENQDAGLELAGSAGALASVRVVRRSARYELIISDRRAGTTASARLVPLAPARKLTSVSPAVFGQFLAGSSTSRSPVSTQERTRRQPFAAADTVRLPGQRFVVAHVRSNRQAFAPTADDGPPLATGAAAATFRSPAAAADALADWVAAVPSLAGTLHVIPAADASAPLAVPGGWAPGGTLPAAAAWTTAADPAVRLADGRILVAGGADADGAALATVALFDPVGTAWAAGPPLAAARRLHTTTLLATGRVLVAGGRAGTSTLDSVELFDPVADAWTTAAGLGRARSGHSATVLRDGTVLVAGGTGGRGAALADVERFDPAAARWSAVRPMTEDRVGHQAVLLADGRVLVIGGTVATGGAPAALAYCELFDPATGTWSPTGSLATPRAGHQATLLPDGTVLVTGGDRAGVGPDGRFHPESLATTERYHPDSAQWTSAAPMNGPRTRHRARLLRSGRVLVTGGTGGPGFTSGYGDVATYDPAADAWHSVSALGTGRWAHATAELTDGRVVVAGGLALAGAAAPGPGRTALTAGTEIFTP